MLMLLLVAVAEMITALGFVIDVPATSSRINVDVVLCLRQLKMLMRLAVAVGQITPLLWSDTNC
jgi:hypothetical protein